MTEEINASVTSSCDDSLVAYAFCKFDMDPDPNIISGIIKDPKTYKVFKIIFSFKTLDVIVYSGSLLHIRDFYRCQPPVDADIQAVLKDEDDECSVNRLLKTITDACRENNRVKKKLLKKPGILLKTNMSLRFFSEALEACSGRKVKRLRKIKGKRTILRRMNEQKLSQNYFQRIKRSLSTQSKRIEYLNISQI